MDLATRNSAMAREAAAAEAHRAKLIELSEREMKALELRVAGASWHHIATVLGFKSTSAARRFTIKAVEKRAAQIDSEPVNQARALLLERYEMLIRTFLPIAATTGDDKAAKVVTSSLVGQARLLGLEAPRRHEHEHTVGESPDQRRAREAAVMDGLIKFNDRTIDGEVTTP